MEAEVLAIVRWPVPALQAARQLHHPRLLHQRTLLATDALEHGVVVGVHEDNRVELLLGSTEFPPRRMRFPRCRQECVNDGPWRCPPETRVETYRQLAGEDRTPGVPAAVNATFTVDAGRSVSPFADTGQGRDDEIVRSRVRIHCEARAASCKRTNRYAADWQVSIAARDESLNIGAVVVGQAGRCGGHGSQARRACRAVSAAMLSTVSSGYALKNVSDGT